MTRLSRITTACFEFGGHPVATSENSVDLSHLAEVHHYTDVVVQPFSADGTHASAPYTMSRPDGVWHVRRAPHGGITRRAHRGKGLVSR